MLLFCSGLVVQVAASAQAQDVPAPPQTGPAAPQAAPAAPAPLPPEQVIARIGPQLIRERDFQLWLRATAGKERSEQMAKDALMLSRIRDRFFETRVLAAKARKDGIDKLPVVQERMRAEEDQALIQMLMNGDEDGTAGKLLKQKIENPSDEEIRAFFDKDHSRYDTPEKFTARHLLVAVKGGPRTADRGLPEDEAKAKIAKLQADLAAGRPFEELVKENSDDPSAKANGGLIKDAAMTGFDRAFEDAVRKQEIGKVGAPVRTIYGYHLILVESRTPRQPAVFEQVKDKVKQQMMPERRQALITAFIEDAKKEIGFVAGPEAAKAAPPAAPKPAAGAKQD
jgi:peptidyl-prolyl cis-trans isomerase C